MTLSTAPPSGSIVVCLDELGPAGAQSVPGPRLVRPDPSGTRRSRATPQIDHGRRGGGDVVGACVPATGLALTARYGARSAANWVPFLEQVEGWLDTGSDRVDAVVDNLAAHRAPDVLLWAVAHPRWAFVFQPTKAADLNRIEPGWKVLRSVALNGRRFETGAEVGQAGEAATAYGNGHRHPCVWGRRQHRRAPRPAGIAALPTPA